MPFLVVSLPFLVLSGAPQILRPSAAHWIVKVQNRFSLSLPFLVASPSNAGNVFLFSVGLVGLQLERLKPSEREDPHHLRHRLGILRRARHGRPLPFLVVSLPFRQQQRRAVKGSETPRRAVKQAVKGSGTTRKGSETGGTQRSTRSDSLRVLTYAAWDLPFVENLL